MGMNKQWGEWFPRTAACELRDDDAEGEDQVKDVEISGRWAHWRDSQWMCRIGKKKAGRQLDGREHNEFPLTGESQDISHEQYQKFGTAIN